jgi:hypothetical protein
MKQFAFPISVKCADDTDTSKCIEIFESIGYDMDCCSGQTRLIVNNYGLKMGRCGDVSSSSIHMGTRCQIDHFNPELIRDIAAACTNDTWQDGEVMITGAGSYMPRTYGNNVSISEVGMRRPTLAEICAHHGYEIKDKYIVKKAPLSANDPILFNSEKCTFIPIDQIQANGVSLEHHIDVEIKLKKALKEIEDLKHEITAWEVKYENIKQVVNR